MSKRDSEKFYWIKLKDSLLTSEKVDFLMSQKDGANYVVLYQCLCLRLINNDGVLGKTIGEVLVPYDTAKISRETKGWFSMDTIRVALELYKNLGLIYQLENGLYRIKEFERLIGSETNAAERMRITRANNRRTIGEQCSLEKDIRDKRLEKEVTNVTEKEKEKYIKRKIDDKTRLNEIKANGFAGELVAKLVDTRYISPFELDTEDYIKLFEDLLEVHSVVDIKVKLDYFISQTCCLLPTDETDSQGKIITRLIYRNDRGIVDKFNYLKESLDKAWRTMEQAN